MLEFKAKFQKRDRELMLFHEKNSFLERVNSDLHKRLEAYEAEEARHQTSVHHDVRCHRIFFMQASPSYMPCSSRRVVDSHGWHLVRLVAAARASCVQARTLFLQRA